MKPLSAIDLLASKISTHVPTDNVLETFIPGLTLMRSSQCKPRVPIVYSPCIYVVAQGGKQAYLENETYSYNRNNFLVLTVALPLEAHVTQASHDSPFLAARLDIELDTLNQLLIDMGKDIHSIKNVPHRAISTSLMNEELINSFCRIIDTLNDKQRAKVLSANIKRELIYNVLCSEQGGLLVSFSQNHRHDFQIASVIHYIQKHYHNSIEIVDLANIANMSQSSFHYHFKTVTQMSPIQYIKSIRLHQAKRFITEDAKSISDAAFQVGYNSSSQFSREYKRLFGVTPSLESKANRI